MPAPFFHITLSQCLGPKAIEIYQHNIHINLICSLADMTCPHSIPKIVFSPPYPAGIQVLAILLLGN